MKIISIIILVFIVVLNFRGQQEAMFTHYNYTPLSFNAAYAGNKETTEVSIINRNQWVGFKGAPITQAINIDAPIKYRNIGIGLSVLNDKIGPLATTSVNFNFAYKFKITKKGIIALGLRGGGDLIKSSANSLETIVANDPFLINNASSLLVPNFGAGIYYKQKNTFIGMGVPRLLTKEFDNSSAATLYTIQKHYYLTGGVHIKLRDKIKYMPTVLAKYTRGAPLEVELTSLFQFQEKFEIGITYRTTDAVAVILGIQINKKMRFGYAFDWSYANQTFRYNQGSHEVILSLSLPPRRKVEVISPRYL